MKKIRLGLLGGAAALSVLFFVLFFEYYYISLNFKYVNKFYNEDIIDDIYPVWNLISKEEELSEFNIQDMEGLDLNNHNYVVCQGGDIVKIKCNVYEYLFKDKKAAYVYVNKTLPQDLYVYEIKKINLRHDLMAAPTTVLR